MLRFYAAAVAVMFALFAVAAMLELAGTPEPRLMIAVAALGFCVAAARIAEQRLEHADALSQARTRAAD
ncbi:hypothetical protein ACFVAJ_17710 [Agromyces sp. NPDC057679]|uniref:hypothetical protein n=1 Tax=Agromyces sp. NPDC057679 TaxID=3346207 RepID=UPI00366CD334